jgi:hypothetical protein
MPRDGNLVLQTSVTKTTTFNGATLNLPGGTPRRGLKARVIYSAGTTTTSTIGVTFSVDVSTDGTTYATSEFSANDNIVVLNTTGGIAGELFIPFETSQPNVRLTATFSAGANGPSLTYFGDVVLARPD